MKYTSSGTGRIQIALALLLASLALCSTPVVAGSANSFTEEFLSTTYRDGPLTSAVWNTGTGLLTTAPFNRSKIGTFPTAGEPMDVTAVGTRLYVASPNGGMLIYDISNPDTPAWLGTFSCPNPWQVQVSGHLAYVADGSSGLLVVDISNPSNPVQLGSAVTTGTISIDIVGHIAYVTDTSVNLWSIDVGDPSNPVVLGSVSVNGTPLSVVVEGNTAYVAAGVNGLVSVDVTDPSNAVVLDQYDTPGYAWGITVQGNVAYLGDGSSGVRAIDISDPQTLFELDQVGLSGGSARRLTTFGDELFIGNGYAVSSVNISDPTSMVHTGNYGYNATCSGVSAEAGKLYVAAGTAGIGIIELAVHCPPATLGMIDTDDSESAIAIEGNVAYVTTRSLTGSPPSMLHAYDVTDPQHPVSISNMDLGTSGEPRFLRIEGNRAYVGILFSEVRIVDISDPGSMTALGTVAVNGLRSIATAGNLIYASDSDGLHVIDASNPLSPTTIQTLTEFDTGLLTIEGSALYDLTDRDLFIYELGSSGVPEPIGSHTFPARPYDLDILGSHAYVADWTGGLKIVDISNTLNLLEIGTWQDPGGRPAMSVRATGNLAYVGLAVDFSLNERTDAVVVLDVSNPAIPVELYRRQYAEPADQKALARGDFFGNFLPVLVNQDTDTAFEFVWTQQIDYDSATNVAQSIPVATSPFPIQRVRLTSVETATPAAWSLSVGGPFESITPGSGWAVLDTPGTNLVWHGTLGWNGPGTSSVVDAVTVDWLVEPPIVDSVSDIPNDEGRNVRVTWNRSSHDFAGDPTPIVQYAIYRQVDLQLAPAQDAEPATVPAFAARRGDIPEWDFVAIVPARADDTYSVIVPTLADSTIVDGLYETAFFVSAMTDSPFVYFDSQPDLGYSVDNLAPADPENITVAYYGNGNRLVWDPSPTPDFRFFRIYRGPDPWFDPDSQHLVGEIVTPDWTDPDRNDPSAFYKISAVDFSGNESGAIRPGTATATDPPPPIWQLALHENVPNPFNPRTTIHFELPAAGPVSLTIYDLAGRVVRRLVSGTHMPVGAARIVWDGTDNQDRSLASGVYVCRLDVAGQTRTRKLTLLK